MALPKVAALIAERLNTTGAKWMATGSIASMSYGEYLEREIAQRGLGDLWQKCL